MANNRVWLVNKSGERVLLATYAPGTKAERAQLSDIGWDLWNPIKLGMFLQAASHDSQSGGNPFTLEYDHEDDE